MKQFSNRRVALSCFALGLFLAAGTWQSWAADPTVVNTTPGDNAFNVSRSAPIVFTFSEPMNTDLQVTFATFQYFDMSTFQQVEAQTTSAWSGGNTVLTCTPVTPFPSTTPVQWAVTGETPAGIAVDGSGSFFTGTSTGGGGTGGGSGTNKITSFTVGKIHFYDQTNNGTPYLDVDTPYMFQASVTLASNRTANAISLAMPTGTTNLSNFTFSPENWHYFDFETNLTRFDAAFPSGNYTYTVNATASNETVTVNLPSTMQQPVAPQIQNYQQLQSIDPTKPLTISWAPWSGGTANDYIFVSAGSYHSPGFEETNAIKGNVTSWVIPANSLTANDTNQIMVGFYRVNWTTNTTEFRGAYKATATQLNAYASGGGTPGPISMGNISWNGSSFGFTFSTTPGQLITIQTSTDLVNWTTWVSTNATGTAVQIMDTRPPGPRLFYRAKNGS